jgi:hypothetical protein
VAYGDGIPAGRFGDWRTGVEMTFRADVGRSFTASEEMALTLRMSEAKAQRDAELKRKQEVASDTVESIWSGCMAANEDHPYLKRKGIGVNGSRVTGDGRLVVPLFDKDGTLSSLQYIDQDGGKLYHPGGATGGRFWMVGTMDEPGTLYAAEGFATAATIQEITGRPCVVAYSASNLVPTSGILRELYGTDQDIVIVADNDASGVGHRYAEQACAKYGARMVMPPVPGDANDYAKAGHDLAGLLVQKVESWLIPADEFSNQPAPISWLVKSWLQEKALIMVHGPSGGGKTFVVLDWCLRIASNSCTTWMGYHKVKQGNVVYLAGEGHHGLRGRLAAWKHFNHVDKLSMWLSKDGCDLNIGSGYLRVLQNIRTIPSPPKLIVVDTLHRFLSGDENSSQDAKTMLDACNALMVEFNCSVILVHHTGVSEDAQHRARGSSAWRGALDIEISIVPAKGDQPMQIVQKKSKDAEMASNVYATLQGVEIPGWLDEDGAPVTSAVVVQADAPPESNGRGKKDISLISEHCNLLSLAYFVCHCEVRDGLPYISRSGFSEYLHKERKLPIRQVDDHLNPAKPSGIVGMLISAEIIAPHSHGWIVTGVELSSILLIRR